MLSAIPLFYDLIEVDRRQLVEVQDVVRDYKHPSTVDIKVGLRTWYAGAEPSYVHRCKLKKAATMQAALSYKVCRMQEQREFLFISSSVLLIYEGSAETAENAIVSIRLVSFPHTFPSEGKKDTNFIAGLRAIIKALTAVMRYDSEDELTF